MSHQLSRAVTSVIFVIYSSYADASAGGSLIGRTAVILSRPLSSVLQRQIEVLFLYVGTTMVRGL